MPTGLAILGFAHGHVGTYCAQWRQWPDDITLVAGWDHDAGRLAASAKQHAVEAVSDVAALLRRADIDAVVIGAETSLHAALVERAAEAGKAIVLQKPLALTLKEAGRIVDAVERTGVPFTLAWQMRVDPQHLEMKRLLEEGVLGRIYMVRRRHGLSTHVWPGFEHSWHVKPELNRGMWADDAAHPIDWLLWLLGEPASVTAEVATLRSPAVPDDHGAAIFRYADGAFAEVMCSFTCVAGENTTEIVGEKGVLIQNYGDAPSCNVPRPSDAVGLKWYLHADAAWTHSDIASPKNHGERIAALARPLLEFLRGRRPPIATAEEGRTALRMTLACYDSAQRGARIRFDQYERTPRATT